MKLTKAQRKYLNRLSPETGHFRQVNHEDVGLSFKGYADLRARKLIEEAWTWMSRTRPDVGLTDAGRAALSNTEGK